MKDVIEYEPGFTCLLLFSGYAQPQLLTLYPRMSPEGEGTLNTVHLYSPASSCVASAHSFYRSLRNFGFDRKCE